MVVSTIESTPQGEKTDKTQTPNHALCEDPCGPAARNLECSFNSSRIEVLCMLSRRRNKKNPIRNRRLHWGNRNKNCKKR